VREKWEELEEFPEYLVSNFGSVYHQPTRNEKLVWYNQQGIASVTLFRQGRPANRSLAVLVARTFLVPEEPRFNTPINLDGDRGNCRIDNLRLRPRPFAIEYHRQFNYEHFLREQVDLEVVQTGERFRYLKEPAIKYGLIARVILSATHQGEEVFPTGHRFRFI
jgi:hypothetical protein